MIILHNEICSGPEQYPVTLPSYIKFSHESRIYFTIS